MMTKTNNIDYIKAYTEVNCLLKHLPETYIKKLPKQLIELIEKQSNNQYILNIDVNKSLLEQNFSQKAKDLIAVIKYNYWSTTSEKQELTKIFYENENKHQKELLEKYNPNDIFKKKKAKTDIVQNQKENTLQMIQYKENIFIRILNKIKKTFNIFKPFSNK